MCSLLRSLPVGALLTAACTAAMATTPCAGQVEVTAYAGGYAPTAAVRFVCYIPDYTADAGPSCGSKQATAPVVGGRVTDWLSTRVAVEGSVGYSPSGVLNTSAHIVTSGVALLVSFKPRASAASVYFTGGIGLVAHGGYAYHYVVGTWGWGPVVGVGHRLKAGPSLAIRAGLEDYLYNFNLRESYLGGLPAGGRFQNDLVFSLGLSVRVPSRPASGTEEQAKSPN